MKKWILFITILLGIGINSYGKSEDSNDMQDVNKILIKEMTYFYGGYKNIYSQGINKDNIIFILNGIEENSEKNLKHSFKKLTEGEIIELKSDENIEISEISDLTKLKIIGKTHKNSNVDFKKENGKLKINFSSIGEYKIAFTDKKQVTKIIIFKKEIDFTPEYANIDRNIEESYSENDVKFLSENLTLLKMFFPDSEKIQETLFYALELNEKNKNYEAIKRISKELVSEYDLDENEKKELINIYLESLKQLDEIDEYLSFLENSSNYMEGYNDQYLDASIKYKNYSKKALSLANDKVDLNPTPEVLGYLGEYYYQLKNYKMAINYYEQKNDVENLAMIYLEIGDERNLEKLKSQATSNELNRIEKEEEKYIERQQVEKYIGTAEEYVKEGRFQEAELYYKRILNTGVDPNIKNDICYKLVEVYYKLDEYQLAKKQLKNVNVKDLDENYLGNYYYLGGMIYYNLEEYDMSSKYFEDLTKKFPNTALSNRGKIYLLRINKLRNKKK